MHVFSNDMMWFAKFVSTFTDGFTVAVLLVGLSTYGVFILEAIFVTEFPWYVILVESEMPLLLRMVALKNPSH